MRFLTILAVLFSFGSTSRADVFELNFSVISGDFRGYWRFADGPEGNTIGKVSCEKNTPTTAFMARDVRWFHGNCVVTILPASQNTAQKATFEILALHAITGIEIGGANSLGFDPLNEAATPTISLTAHETGGTITINTVNVRINPNGYEGDCSFEYILNETGGSRNSCDGQFTALPRGTTFQLFAAGRAANPVHISHQGIPYPEGNGRVYREGNSTIAFRTIDVTMTPISEAPWHIEGVTPAGTWITGPQTLRLVQNNPYNLAVDTGQPDFASAIFKLEPRCGTPVQMVYVDGYGVFFMTQICSP